MISINEVIDVEAAPARVWELLSDPNAVVSCISGAELGQTNDGGTIDGTLLVKFGPLRVKFNGRVELELDEAARQGRLRARGRDALGGTRAIAEATFGVIEQDGGSGSTITFTSDVELTGKLASVVEAGATTVVRRMTAEFAQNLSARFDGAAPASATDDTAAPSGDTPLPATGRGPRQLWRRVLAGLRRLWRQPTG